MSKPEVPNWSDLSHDQRLIAAATALGITDFTPPTSQYDRVYDAAVIAATTLKRAVKTQDIRGVTGYDDLSTSTIASALESLQTQGKMLKVCRGTYMPVVNQ